MQWIKTRHHYRWICLQLSKRYYWLIGDEESDLRSKSAINVVKKFSQAKKSIHFCGAKF